ncbi:hypothetical protein AB4120_24250 [Cupriavidus sp. 2KB_3]|uniref:hypothetical protein n=1 Tax=Cupriavidus sp. 2KB_3 TaxID=3232980 RepID=UPI0011EC072E
MAESLIFMGRHVSFELTERTFGVWHWAYTLDDQARFESQGMSFPTRELAMADAMRDAKIRIERSPE